MKGNVVRSMPLRESRGRVHRSWREEKEKGKTS